VPSGDVAVLLTELLTAAVLTGALLAAALMAGTVVKGERAREVVLVEGLGPVVLGWAFRLLAGVKSVLRDVICVMPPLNALWTLGRGRGRR
jgi:hypothetical protein